jgi:hypothetical protein
MLLAVTGALLLQQIASQGNAQDRMPWSERMTAFVDASTATMHATPASDITLVTARIVDDCGDEEGEPTPCTGPCHGMCACILGHFAAHPATESKPPLETVREVAIHDGIARGVRRPSTEPSLRPPIG